MEEAKKQETEKSKILQGYDLTLDDESSNSVSSDSSHSLQSSSGDEVDLKRRSSHSGSKRSSIGNRDPDRFPSKRLLRASSENISNGNKLSGFKSAYQSSLKDVMPAPAKPEEEKKVEVMSFGGFNIQDQDDRSQSSPKKYSTNKDSLSVLEEEHSVSNSSGN